MWNGRIIVDDLSGCPIFLALYCYSGSLHSPFTSHNCFLCHSRLLPKKILKGPSELNAENLGAQHMKWKVLLWKIKAPRAILWEPQATGLLLGNSLVITCKLLSKNKVVVLGVNDYLAKSLKRVCAGYYCRALATTTATATRTWSLNVNSRYCNRFATIPSILTWQRCSKPSRMKLLWTALNLGKTMKIYPHVLTFSLKRPSHGKLEFANSSLVNSSWCVWTAQKQSVNTLANCWRQIELVSILANRQRNRQKWKDASAGRAKLFLLLTKYANLWRSR